MACGLDISQLPAGWEAGSWEASTAWDAAKSRKQHASPLPAATITVPKQNRTPRNTFSLVFSPTSSTDVPHMSPHRGLPPTAGVLLCLGTSVATAVVLGDPSSEPRRQIASRASEKRRDILVRALSKRLLQQRNAQRQQETALLPQETLQDSVAPIAVSSSPTAESEVATRFHVVTGPDANLTSLAAERLSRALLARRTDGNHGSIRDLPSPARLVVPYGCAVGTGCFSTLVEGQLLQALPHLDIGGGSSDDSSGHHVVSQTAPTTPHNQQHYAQQQQQQQQQLEPSNTASGSQEEVETTESETEDSSFSTGASSPADRRLVTTVVAPSVSRWGSLVLSATRAVMGAEQLDRDALWALERALSAPTPPSLRTTAATSPQQRTPPFENGACSIGDDASSLVGSQTASLDETTTTANTKDGEIIAPIRFPHDDYEYTTTTDSKNQLIGRTNEKRASILTNAEHTNAAATTMGDEDQGLEAGGAFTGEMTVVEESVAEPPTVARSNFVLEIIWPDGGQAGKEADAEESECGERIAGKSRQLCGELARWGWKLTTQGLGHVIVSSPNPWVLAELQGALQAKSEQVSSSPQNGEISDSRAAAATGGIIEAGGEVVVTRVALPSAAEQEQAVVSIAEELAVDHLVSASDVSTLAALTGGRRAGLLDALERVQGSSTVTVTEACQAAVDDQARALAVSWGLLSCDAQAGDSLGEHGHGVTTDKEMYGGRKPGAPAALTDAARGIAGGGGGDVAAAGDRRKQWAALWEALAVLSLPRVAVGAAHSSAPSPPHGSMPPAELCGACEMDSDTMQRLTREMWLEVSPAMTPGSGTVLRDKSLPPTATIGQHPRRRYRPPVTVHSAAVPLDSLARLDRSFVGAPPLRLAAFRRLIDSVTFPQRSKGNREGVVFGGAGRGDAGRVGEKIVARAVVGGVESVEGEGGGKGRACDFVSAWGKRDRELERVGCLVEASVLGRMFEREGGKLFEDGIVLTSDWAELDKARRDLQRHGKGDASEGEWAEVQLELIRQERAVAARAHEMRARRTRHDNLERDILGLEKRATALLSWTPPPPQETQQDFSRPTPVIIMPPETFAVTPTDDGANAAARFSTNAEDAVIREAEGGVRLMPLLGGVAEPAGGGDSVEEKSVVDGGGGRWGYGGKLWRWIRRA